MYRILFTIIAILLILIIYKHKVLLLFSNSVNRCKQIHEPFDSTDFKQEMNSHDHYFEKQISDKKDIRRNIVNGVNLFDISDDDLNKTIDKEIITEYLISIKPFGYYKTDVIEKHRTYFYPAITKINKEIDTEQKKKLIKLLLIKLLLDKEYKTDSYDNLPCVYYDTDNCPDTCVLNTGVKTCNALKTKSECNARTGCKYDDLQGQCKPEHLCMPKTRIIDKVKECNLYSKYGLDYCTQLRGSDHRCKYDDTYKICHYDPIENKYNKVIANNRCLSLPEASCVTAPAEGDPRHAPCEYDSELGICGPKFNTQNLNCNIYDSVYTNDNTEIYDNKKSLCVNNKDCNFIEYNIKPQDKYLQNNYFGKCVNDTDLKTLIGTDTNEKNPELIQVFNAENHIDIKTVIRINKAKNVCESLGDHYEWIKNSDLSHEGEYRCIPKCEILNKENCDGDPNNCYFNELDDVCKLKCGVTETRDGCIKNGDCYWEDSGNTGYCHSLTKENNTEICGKIKSSDCEKNLNCYYDTDYTQCKAKDTDLDIMGTLLTDY